MIELSADHRYIVEGQEWPGFTRIAQTTGIIRKYTGDPWYGERGTAVHRATVMIDNNTLDWESVDERIGGFLDAYVKFRHEHPIFFPSELSEHSLSHSTYKFCGTLDRFPPLIDLKTGESNPIQLEAYAELLRANGYDPGRQGYMLHLQENGNYKLETHKFDRKLLGVWLSACSVWWFRKEKGLL